MEQSTVFICLKLVLFVYFFRQVGFTEVALLGEMTSVVVDYFAPRSEVDPNFQATWAFLATWSQVAGFGIENSLVRCDVNYKFN